jgi:hypothetical protein
MQAAARARRRSVRRSCAPSFGAWIVLLTLLTFLHGPVSVRAAYLGESVRHSVHSRVAQRSHLPAARRPTSFGPSPKSTGSSSRTPLLGLRSVRRTLCLPVRWEEGRLPAANLRAAPTHPLKLETPLP